MCQIIEKFPTDAQMQIKFFNLTDLNFSFVAMNQ